MNITLEVDGHCLCVKPLQMGSAEHDSKKTLSFKKLGLTASQIFYHMSIDMIHAVSLGCFLVRAPVNKPDWRGVYCASTPSPSPILYLRTYTPYVRVQFRVSPLTQLQRDSCLYLIGSLSNHQR